MLKENKMDIQTQAEIEKISNKNQLMPRLRKVFSDPVIVNHILDNNIPLNFGIDLMCQIALHKRATLQIMVGTLFRHFGEEPENIQQCIDMITKAALVDLCSFDELSGEFVVTVDIPADVQRDLDRFQYPMPMVVPPRKLKDNRSTAYYTGGGSVILQGYNHHSDDVCLDHLNRMNQVELCLNMDTARLISNKWSDLDRQKDGESAADYKKRVAAFKRYDRNARDVMELIYVAGNSFYMTHRYDKRGRTYSQGYHINPQGNDWSKAVIEFAEGEVING